MASTSLVLFSLIFSSLMRHHRSLLFFRFGLTPLNAGAASLLLSSLFSVWTLVGEPVEDGDEEGGLGVEDRDRE